MKNAFEWSEDYSVHSDLIDGQHKQLFKIIFELFEAINNQSTKEKIGETLASLVEYTGYHFGTEENYFKLFEYENAEEHIREHKKFADKIQELQKRYVSHEVEVSFELIDFLEDWLVTHIHDTDQKYVTCFTTHGLK
jgi:hemerythrin-like metal-binding protein